MPVSPDSTMRMNPLLRDFESVSTSIDTSTKALGELNRQLASLYMTAFVSKTSVDKQSIALESLQLQSKLEKGKAAAQMKRSIIARLRGEQEKLRTQLEEMRRPKSTPNGVVISPSGMNTWFTVALLLLPLIAIFMAARIVLHQAFV